MLNYKILKSLPEINNIAKEWQSRIHETKYQLVDRMQHIAIMESYLDNYKESKKCEPYFVFFYQDNKLIALAPFYQEEIKYPLRIGLVKLLSVNLKALKVFGEKVLILNKELENKVNETLTTLLYSPSINYDLLLLDKVPDNNSWPLPDLQVMDQENKLTLERLNSEKVIVRTIEFPETYDEYLTGLTRKSRYKYKKSVKNFTEQFTDKFQFTCYQSAENVEEFFTHLDKIYQNTWQAKTFGLKKRNTSEAIKHHKTIATHHQFLSYILFVDNKPIAFILGYISNRQYLYFEIGYNDLYKRSEPGKVLAWLLIEDLYKNHCVDTLDFDTGENNYKKVLGNAHYFCNNLLITRSYSYASVIIKIQKLFQKLYRSIHSLTTKLGIEEKVRQLVKRKKA